MLNLIEKSHDYIVHVFEACITDKLREIFEEVKE